MYVFFISITCCLFVRIYCVIELYFTHLCFSIQERTCIGVGRYEGQGIGSEPGGGVGSGGGAGL